MRGVIGNGEAPSDARLLRSRRVRRWRGSISHRASSTRERYTWGDPDAQSHIVAYDYGIKRNILRLFEENGCRVTVVPADTPAAAVLEAEPDGVFLANGPGDPAAVGYAPGIIRAIAAKQVPILGICLGHQLLGLTFGARTSKMPYGHRGGNHPVREIDTDRVLITSQNHGFAVVGDEQGIPGAPDLRVTHVNLNDGTVEGLGTGELPIFAVQYHPEAAPGPHDARPLFGEFLRRSDRAGPPVSQTLDTQRLTSYFRRTIGHVAIANPRLRMTKADLVEHVTAQISKTAGPMISKKDCARVVDAFLDAIKDALKEQKNIEVRGFGTFKIRQRKTRMARNPRTGSPVEVSARPVPVFKPSKELRALVAEEDEASFSDLPA